MCNEAVQIDGYKLSNYYCRSYFRVCIISLEEIDITVIPEVKFFCEEKVYECAAISFSVGDKNLIVCGIYLYSIGDIEQRLIHILAFMVRKRNTHDDLVLCGDFNIIFYCCF